MIGQLAWAAVVVALLLCILRWARRRGFAGIRVHRARQKQLERLERLPLSAQHTLHLVRLGDCALLVASSPGGCSLVQSIPYAGVKPAEGPR